MAEQKQKEIDKMVLLAKEIDDRYMRVMEKMDLEGTWTEEVNARFDRMYADFDLRWGRYLKANASG